MGIKQTSSSSKKQPVTTSHKHKYTRIKKCLIGIVGVILLLILGIYIASQVSPWPNALLIRDGFDKSGRATATALEKHVPSGITTIENKQYRTSDKDAYLDVFYPSTTTEQLPTVVWVHGGAWVSGDKDEVDNYLKIIASKGYTVVGVNYSIAPEHQYPLPIIQVNDALGYLQLNASELHVNPNRIALAGDSAGSQIAAQVANLITSPAYAKDMNIYPELAAEKLKATILNCGAYDLSLPDYNGDWGKFLHTVLWAYAGTSDFIHDPALRHASVVNYVTKEFPSSFITAGNADPLEEQSTEFAKKLHSLGVATSTLFYPDNHEPKLQHEYQFNLDNQDGAKALEQMTAFLEKHLR